MKGFTIVMERYMAETLSLSLSLSMSEFSDLMYFRTRQFLLELELLKDLRS